MNKLSFFKKLPSLKVMLVLYKNNIGVTFADLQKEVDIDGKSLEQLLEKLINAELVHARVNGSNIFFILSVEARMSLTRILQPFLKKHLYSRFL